jgi:zinc D-Ala-D-Ala carboxypeptidase
VQLVRDYYGRMILISSGFRCKKVNKRIKGAKNSQHMFGYAADLNGEEDKDNSVLFHTIKDRFDFDQLIWEFGNDEYPDWVHVSYSLGNNRGQVLKAIRKQNKFTRRYKTHYILY